MKMIMKLSNLLPSLNVTMREAIEKTVENVEEATVSRKFVYPLMIADEKAGKLKEGEKAIIQYVSTRDMDRDNEILLPKGAMLKEFKLAPQVLWGHDYSIPPVGKDEWIKPDDKGLMAKTVYAPTERGKELWQLRKGGFLNTSSVGFIPFEHTSPGAPDWDETLSGLKSEWPELKKTHKDLRRIIKKWLLLEHSDVSVPANIHALTLAVAKGLKMSNDLRDQLGICSTKVYGIPDMVKVDIDRDKFPELKGVEDCGVIDLYEKGASVENPSVDGKPFPNFHTCRVVNQSDFDNATLRTVDRTSGEKKLMLIMGKLIGKNTLTLQSFRYDKEIWSVDEAKEHCKAHNGKLFEPAKPARSIEVINQRSVEVVKEIEIISLPGQEKADPLNEAEEIKRMVKDEFDRMRGRV